MGDRVVYGTQGGRWEGGGDGGGGYFCVFGLGCWYNTQETVLTHDNRLASLTAISSLICMSHV